MTKTMLDKAYANLIYAKEGFKHADNEIVFDLVAYHLQQAVEACIKHVMSMHGVESIRNHDIRVLIQQACREHIDLKLPEYIDDHAEMYSVWGNNPRYRMEFMLELLRAEKAYNAAVEYFLALEKEYAPGRFRNNFKLRREKKNDSDD